VNEYGEQFDQSLSESSTASVYTGGCDPCGGSGQCGDGGCGSSCDSGPGGLCDNLELFAGGDGWKNHGDDDDNNNFGYRLGANSAFGGSNIRFQIGGSYGFYDFHGREDPEEVPTERQLFVTGGVYKRSKICCGDRLSWGVVYDYMNTNNWGEQADNLDLGQIRARIGYAINACQELGAWAAVGIDDDLTGRLGGGVKVEAKDQINVYWLHNYSLGGETMLYVGLADEPNGHLQTYDSPNLTEVVFGLRGRAPLSEKLALYGNVHYILPGTTGGDIAPNSIDNSYAEEVWNVSIGLVFYPGAKARARTVSGNAGLPLLPVADNGTFSVNTPTGAL
jgi:hypothetical protein